MVDQSFSEKRVRQELAFDPRRAAVLVVDMLNDFLEDRGAMVLPEGRRLYQPINRLLRTARTAGAGVIWICDDHPPGPDWEFGKRVPHCLAGTWGAEVVAALERLPDETRVGKRRYSGFFGTDLDIRLREMGVAYVIATGVVTNICVRSTVHDAFFLGYDVIVPRQCVAGTSARENESTLYDIDTHFGTVADLDEVLAILRGGTGTVQTADTDVDGGKP